MTNAWSVEKAQAFGPRRESPFGALGSGPANNLQAGFQEAPIPGRLWRPTIEAQI